MSGAPKPEHPNDRAVYLIYFDDQDVKPKIVIGEAAAMAVFKRVSMNWNAHLFGKLKSNSRDDRYYEANIASLPSLLDAEPITDAERYRFWRRYYSSRYAIRPDKATLIFQPLRPAVEVAGPDYEAKIDAAIDAAIREERGRNG